MPIKTVITKGKVPVKIYTDQIEPQAYAQLLNMSDLPIIHSHIAAMPDVHLGKGATVGSVIPTLRAIIPAAVGVDIGCGMSAVRLSISAEVLPDNLRAVRSAIESVVPVGYAMHKKDVARRSTISSLSGGLNKILERHPKIANLRNKPYLPWVRQLGTLGGGNHFIEICLDEDDAVWVMLHSGSRGIGNTIGQYFIALAKTDAERVKLSLPDKDLAYFEEGAEHFDDYFHAVQWAQDYAKVNRQEIMRLVIDELRRRLPCFEVTKEAINCHHNYVSVENHFDQRVYVTRKGAIRAGLDELGIVPGSMGAKSYIVRGKGNPTSFDSCAHGAGRQMSRSKAKRQFSTLDLEEQTAGIECRKDKGVVDEIPGAYKNIDEVMANQSDLAEVVHTLRQLICVKG
jgi:tRNA-splicing ligase RtcB (3'-phosphate/5'-hydroxy nucleic acid ligase)